MNSKRLASKHVIILGIDTFAKKNIAQIQELEKEGWTFSVVTNDQRLNSCEVFGRERFLRSRLYIAKGSFISRLRLLRTILSDQGAHHVELYAAGRMTILYLLLLKAMKCRIVVIERGDVGSLDIYDWSLTASLRAAYKAADAIVYKETYMEEILREYSNAPLFFVPNSIGERVISTTFAGRSVHFLWVNRIVPQRRAEWLIESFGEEDGLAGCSLAFLGLESRNNIPIHLKDLQKRIADLDTKVELLEFGDPEPFYSRARFFCLPSSLVFGNNSLLEAMASGVVPIVTQAPGVDLIVQHGINGIVTPFDKGSYREGLRRAASLNKEQWTHMSEAAVATVRRDYSLRTWSDKMLEAYASLAL